MMAMRITADTATEQRYLELHEGEIECFEGNAAVKARRYAYEEVEYILVSRQNRLTVQVDKALFTIPIRPSDRPVLDVLLERVRATVR